MSRTFVIAAAGWILALLVIERLTSTDVQLLWSGPLIVLLSIGTEIVVEGRRSRRSVPPVFMSTSRPVVRTQGEGDDVEHGWRSMRSMMRILFVSVLALTLGLVIATVSTPVGGTLAVAGLVGLLFVVYLGGFLAK